MDKRPHYLSQMLLWLLLRLAMMGAIGMIVQLGILPLAAKSGLLGLVSVLAFQGLGLLCLVLFRRKCRIWWHLEMRELREHGLYVLAPPELEPHQLELNPKANKGLIWKLYVRIQLENQIASELAPKGEAWAVKLGWLIPRRYRDAVLGDLKEDCNDMRKAGCSERRIRIHVLYQWTIAVISLVPAAARSWTVDFVKKMIGR